jgi:CelD/BcsL family acetyltransferase involved in cellulose biosynthesis
MNSTNPTFTDPSLVRSTPLTWRSYGPSEFDEALHRWRFLERRLNSKSIACSATWTDTWLRHYGDLVPCRILTAEADGETRGICLLTEGVGQKAGPFQIRTRHIGTAGEPQVGSACVEYNRLLVEPDSRQEFIAGVAEAVQDDLRWEQFRLDGMAEENLEDWLPYFPQATVRKRESKYFDLRKVRTSGDDILARLGKSTRSNIRRRLKQYGELECEWASSVEQMDEIFLELIKLHQDRWEAAGEPGAFANTRFLAFQLELGVRLFTEERNVLFRVRHQGETVGCLMLLVDGNRLLNYLSGFASFEKHPSPGLITNYLCIQEALRRGYDAFDFLVGDSQYKDNLSTHVTQLCWMSCSRPTLKMKAIHALRQARRTVKQLRYE